MDLCSLLSVLTGPVAFKVAIPTESGAEFRGLIWILFFFLLTTGKGVAVSALLSTWILVYPAKMKGEVDSFVNLMRRSGSDQGFNMPNPIE